MRKILVPLAFALVVATAPASADPAPERTAAALIDAGAPDDALPVIAVDPGAGTVTPAPGTLPDQVTSDPARFAGRVIAALRGGQWRLLAALVLAAVMALGVRYGGRLFGTTDRGKAIAVMTLALLGTMSAELAGVAPLSPQLLAGGVALAFTAVGGRQWISRILWPTDGGRQWITWLKPWFGVQPAAAAPIRAA